MSCFGSEGEQDGQFNYPQFVAVTVEGKILVSDQKRVQVFNADFCWICTFNGLKRPTGVAVDSNGDVFVADFELCAVFIFRPDGTQLRKFGSCSLNGENGSFRAPWGVAVDGRDQVFVVDSGRRDVQVFRRDGTFLSKFGGLGWEDGKFRNPSNVVVSPFGVLFVSDEERCDVQVGIQTRATSLSFVWSSSWFRHVYVLFCPCQVFDNTGHLLGKFGTQDSALGQRKFVRPCGLSFSHAGHLWVSDFWKRFVQIFTSEGVFLWSFDLPHNDPTGLCTFGVTGMCFDPTGRVLLCDRNTHRILVFAV